MSNDGAREAPLVGQVYRIGDVWGRNLCGYQADAGMRNGGCGCAHPDQEERDEDGGIGLCYSYSCPLGWEPTNGEMVAQFGRNEFTPEPTDDPAYDYLVWGDDR